jgi:TetR/AcrR family transcriptional regulator, cholesterol catabolism regulator
MFIPDRTDADYAEMEDLLLAFIDDVRQATTASEPLARLRQLVAAHVRWRLEHPRLSELFDVSIGVRTRVSSLPDEHRARIRAIKRMYVDELRAVLLAGSRQGTFHFGDVRVTAFAIVTLCGSVHTWYDPAGDLAVEQVASMYADLAAGMVRAPLCAHEL